MCTRSYWPVKDGQESVVSDIYESEFQDDKYDAVNPNKRFVGTVKLMLPPNSSKSLNLSCRMCLNAEGILEVEASEPSGKKVEATFNIHAL